PTAAEGPAFQDGAPAGRPRHARGRVARRRAAGVPRRAPRTRRRRLLARAERVQWRNVSRTDGRRHPACRTPGARTARGGGRRGDPAVRWQRRARIALVIVALATVAGVLATMRRRDDGGGSASVERLDPRAIAEATGRRTTRA